jgi:LPXTG-motif cell wall-anchored protein
MKIGRLLLGTGALTVSALLVAPGLASAHTARVTPSCTGLAVSVEAFLEGVVTTVTVDGQQTTRSGNGQWTVPWDSATAHTWAVFVDGVGEADDKPFSGTQQACIGDTSSTQPAATTTTASAEATSTLPGVTTTTSGGASTTTGLPASTTTPGATTTTAAPGATTTTGLGSVGGEAGNRPQGSTGPRATNPTGLLPATGYGTGPLAAAGAVVLVAGMALLLAKRRGSTADR